MGKTRQVHQMRRAEALESRGLPRVLLYVIPVAVLIVAGVAVAAYASGLFATHEPVTAKVIWCSTIPTDGCRILLTNSGSQSVAITGQGKLTVGVQDFPLTCAANFANIAPGVTATVACTGQYDAPWGMTVSGTVFLSNGSTVRFTTFVS